MLLISLLRIWLICTCSNSIDQVQQKLLNSEGGDYLCFNSYRGIYTNNCMSGDDIPYMQLLVALGMISTGFFTCSLIVLSSDLIAVKHFTKVLFTIRVNVASYTPRKRKLPA